MSDQNPPANGSVALSTSVDAENPAAQMLRIIRDAARDPAVDVSKMEAMMRLSREFIADQAKVEFNAAFSRLAPKLPRVTRKGEVRYPLDKSRPEGPTRHAFNYARYEDIDLIIRPLLLEYGFTISFDTEPMTDGRIVVEGELLHSAGHSKKTRIGPLPLDTSGGKNNVQAVGSTTSYGKRYCVIDLLNLVFEGADDDGRAGGREFIDAHAVKQLSDLLMETRSDLAAFCRAMGVDSIPEIEVINYPAAVNALLTKKRRSAEAKS